MTGSSTAAHYAERLWPGPAAWAVVPLVGLGTGLIFVPFGAVATAIGAIVGSVLVLAGLVLASPSVQVNQGRLVAGRAAVDVSLLGEPESFRGEEARWQRGPGLDARAYLLLRGWVDPVVRVPLDDPADPTPYWLISTRFPDRLQAAVNDARR